MTLEMLQDWCRWMDVNIQRTLILLGIPEDCREEEFQEAVWNSLCFLGRYQVLGKVFRKDLGTNVALVEFSNDLHQSMIPQQIPGKGGPWQVIYMSPVSQAECQDISAFSVQSQEHEVPGRPAEGGDAGVSGASSEAAVELVASVAGATAEAGAVHAEGNTWYAEILGEARMEHEVGATSDAGYEDVAGGLGAAAALGVFGGRGSAEALAQQWKCALQPVLESLSCQELRPFTGCEEPGPEEESLNSWLDHAYETVYSWFHLSEGEKRRLLLESLNGLALEILCFLLAEDPDLSAQDCLVRLAQVFGSHDPHLTVRLELLTCTQEPEECLFNYVIRQELLLQKAVEKGAVHRAEANHVRTRQVVMRGRPNPILCNQLRWMRMEGRPPTVSVLLQLIEESEKLEVGQLQENDGTVNGLVALGHAFLDEGPNVLDTEEPLGYAFLDEGPNVLATEEPLGHAFLDEGPNVLATEEPLEYAFLDEGPNVLATEEPLEYAFLDEGPNVLATEEPLGHAFLDEGPNVLATEEPLGHAFLDEGPNVLATEEDMEADDEDILTC